MTIGYVLFFLTLFIWTHTFFPAHNVSMSGNINLTQRSIESEISLEFEDKMWKGSYFDRWVYSSVKAESSRGNYVCESETWIIKDAYPFIKLMRREDHVNLQWLMKLNFASEIQEASAPMHRRWWGRVVCVCVGGGALTPQPPQPLLYAIPNM